MVTLKKFTELDWSCYAGAEGPEPKIGGIVVRGPSGDLLPSTIIVDQTGIQIYTDQDKHGDEHWYMFLGTEGQAGNEWVTSLLPDQITFTQLTALGFKYERRPGWNEEPAEPETDMDGTRYHAPDPEPRGPEGVDR